MSSIMRRFWGLGHSFQAKLMLTLLLPALAIGVSVLVTSGAIVERQKSFVGEQQVSAAKFQAAQLNEEIKDRWEILEAMADNLDLNLLSTPGYASRFLSQRYTLKTIFDAGSVVFDRAGMALGDYPVLDGRKGSNYADREFLKRLFATGKPTISLPFVGRPSGKQRISMCVPITGADQQVRGAVCGNLDVLTSNFLGNLSNPEIMGSNEFLLARISDRALIASTDKRRVMSQLPDNPLAQQLMTVSGKAFVAINSRSVEKLYVSVPVAAAGWALILTLPTEIAYEPILATVASLRVRAALASLLVMLIAFFVTRRMLRPLQQAGLTLDAMSSGREPMQRLVENGDTEVRKLLISFNRLSDRLLSQQEQLHDERNELHVAQNALSQLNQGLESKVAERTFALSASNQQLSLATDSAQIGIWEYTLAGDKISWSNWMYAMYGVRQEDFGGAYAAWRAGLHPDDAARGDFEIAQALRGDKEFDTEFRVIWPSGEVRHIKAAAVVQRDEQGAAVRMIGVNYDITQLKNSEQSLAEARRLAESANVAKSNFLANMSHEIRSPLNVILGLSYLLEQSQLAHDAQSLVRKIKVSGRLLLSLIDRILDMSKIEAGQLVIEQAPFRLSDVMDNVAVALVVAVGKKDIEIIMSPVPAGVSSIMGDALRLEQVLINLVSNAVKFTEVGSIQVNTALQGELPGESLGDAHSPGMLRFSVKDTGIGIAPEVQGSVFSAFAQADTSTTRRFGGTGLGLTICRQLVQLMGGEIGVTSTPGVGSEFWFTLPLLHAADPNDVLPSRAGVSVLIGDDGDMAPQAMPVAPQAVSDGLTGLHVLVVDDSDINREVAQRILVGQGATVALAEDGQQAIDWLLAHGTEVDIVLMDVQMPVLDGMEATRRLRRMPQFAGLPIVALTASAFESQQDAALAAGMTHFVSKPFDIPATVDLLQRLCRSPRPMPPEAALPVMDVFYGLDLWADVSTYQIYLRRFVGDYSEAAQRMQTYVVQGERASAAALAHKLSGVAANLALPATHRAAQDLERVLGTDDDATVALAKVGEALASALAEIDRYAPPTHSAPGTANSAEMPALPLSAAQQQALKPHLIALLAALDTDNASPVKACLTTLAQHLPPDALSAIWPSVLGYNFREAEARTQQLATQLKIDLGE